MLWHVLQHDGADEVRSRTGGRSKALGDGTNILPKWSPLSFLLPNVGTLVEGNHVPAFLMKELADGDIAYLHRCDFARVVLRLGPKH